jgi:hypothetical protein
MWGFLVGVVGSLLGFFNTAIDAVVASLVWAVGALQAGAILLWNGIKGALDLARVGFVKVWDFLKPLYDDILKPAWETFWRWFDKLRTWLNNTFGPLLKWLIKLRAELLNFWKTYIRPWLDLIDVTRKILRTLASLGLTWARALDQRLGAIEDAIEAPFRFVLGKLNEIIGIVNNVITLDGLIQRVSLLRSVVRDYQYVWRAIVNPFVSSSGTPDEQHTRAALATIPAEQVSANLQQYLADGSGPIAPAADEWAAQLGIYLRS